MVSKVSNGFLGNFLKSKYIEKKNKVYFVDKKGKILLSKNGYLSFYDDKENYAIVKENGTDRTLVFKNKKKVLESKKIGPVVGIKGSYLVYAGKYEYNYLKIWCMDLKSKKQPVLLGTIDLESLDLPCDYYLIKQTEFKNSDFYFSFSVYNGNANFLSGAAVYKGTMNKKNSLKLMTTDLVTTLGNKEHIKAFKVTKDGKVKTFIAGDEKNEYVFFKDVFK